MFRRLPTLKFLVLCSFKNAQMRSVSGGNTGESFFYIRQDAVN